MAARPTCHQLRVISRFILADNPSLQQLYTYFLIRYITTVATTTKGDSSVPSQYDNHHLLLKAVEIFDLWLILFIQWARCVFLQAILNWGSNPEINHYA